MMKVAVLGPEGTFTHQAGNKYFSEYEAIFYPSLFDIFNSNIKLKIIPFENSLGGSVDQAIDLLKESDDRIIGEQIIEISLCLLSNSDLADIKRIYSHPKALSQCRKFLSKYDWDTIEVSSTAKAAKLIKSNEGAIASKLAGKQNRLKILREDIQDKESFTRFLILKDEYRNGNKTSFILEPEDDYPGLLKDILTCFADRNVNLSYIQSRPTKNKLGEYYFYIEAEISRNTIEFEEVINRLKNFTKVKIVGSYSTKR